MKKLEISPELKLPVNVVTEKLAMIGRTGSGKSYAATKLAELMHLKTFFRYEIHARRSCSL